MINEIVDNIVDLQKKLDDIDLIKKPFEDGDESDSFWQSLEKATEKSGNKKSQDLEEFIEKLKEILLPCASLVEYIHLPSNLDFFKYLSQKEKFIFKNCDEVIKEENEKDLIFLIECCIDSSFGFEAFNLILLYYSAFMLNSKRTPDEISETCWFKRFRSLAFDEISPDDREMGQKRFKNLTSTPCFKSKGDHENSLGDTLNEESRKRVRFSLGPEHVSADLEESLGGRSNRSRLNDLSLRRQTYLNNSFTFFPCLSSLTNRDTLMGHLISRIILFSWYIFAILSLLFTVSSVFSLLSFFQKSLISNLFESVLSLFYSIFNVSSHSDEL